MDVHAVDWDPMWVKTGRPNGIIHECYWLRGLMNLMPYLFAQYQCSIRSATFGARPEYVGYFDSRNSVGSCFALGHCPGNKCHMQSQPQQLP